ncbi:nuclear transport factor 2 family protein [Aurantimonas sp. HBX-1]|uniref:nuclear transport factor 2 family protein n=1 Tax=Aurantimonas sp. HBX-1 TaxID=2906072 RepID=UPI001F3A8058|nr:nuclear transport factor 2 family protein [Aurantimonas sp. HBX-1]UIJ73458.1 nuclear transport factor 2 family protein [Aurantimonas sp. HBX-1]
MENLVEVWEKHLGAELYSKDIDGTMATMVDDPYVNHVPTMTGGVGAKELRRFYAHHFITVQPEDLEVTPVSRTVGQNMIVDEMVVRFTHDRRVDYFLPGVEPTNRRIEIAAVVIAKFRDGKLAHEHIYWDQACVLVQAGLLERGDLPIAGVEATHKVLDPTLPSNRLMHREWAESEGRF